MLEEVQLIDVGGNSMIEVVTHCRNPISCKRMLSLIAFVASVLSLACFQIAPNVKAPTITSAQLAHSIPVWDSGDFCSGGIGLCLAAGIIYYRDGRWWTVLVFGLLIFTAFLWVAGRGNCHANYSEHRQPVEHDGANVSRWRI